MKDECYLKIRCTREVRDGVLEEARRRGLSAQTALLDLVQAWLAGRVTTPESAALVPEELLAQVERDAEDILNAVKFERLQRKRKPPHTAAEAYPTGGATGFGRALHRAG